MIQTQSPFKTVTTRPYIAKAMQFKKEQAEPLLQAMLLVFPGSVRRFGLDRFCVMCSGMPVEICEGDWIVYSTKYNAFHVFTDAQYKVMFTEPEDLQILDVTHSGLPLTLEDLDAENFLLLDEVNLMTDIAVGKDLIDSMLIHITPLVKDAKPMTFCVMPTNPGSVTPVLGLSQGGVLVTKGKFRALLKEACR